MTSTTHPNPETPTTPPLSPDLPLSPASALALLEHYLEEAVRPVTYCLVATAHANAFRHQGPPQFDTTTNSLRSLQADLPSIIRGLHFAVYGVDPGNADPVFHEPAGD